MAKDNALKQEIKQEVKQESVQEVKQESVQEVKQELKVIELQQVLKEQCDIIERLEQELKECYKTKCTAVTLTPPHDCVGTRKDNVYEYLTKEKEVYIHFIKELKHRIIEHHKVDLCKAKLRDAKKDLKRIKKTIRQALR